MDRFFWDQIRVELRKNPSQVILSFAGILSAEAESQLEEIEQNQSEGDENSSSRVESARKMAAIGEVIFRMNHENSAG